MIWHGFLAISGRDREIKISLSCYLVIDNEMTSQIVSAIPANNMQF